LARPISSGESSFNREEAVPAYVKMSVPMVLAGVAVMSPGPKDTLLSYLNQTLHVGLSLDAPLWSGIFLIVCGLAIFLIGFIAGLRTDAGRFIAIRHQSFKPLAAELPNEALPQRLSTPRIRYRRQASFTKRCRPKMFDSDARH
jgi:hypothetical protein